LLKKPVSRFSSRPIRALGTSRTFKDREIALVVLTQGRWELVRRRLAEIAAAVNAATPGSYTELVIPFE
jgi:hypothetical protein